jgi:hypothetical protein
LGSRGVGNWVKAAPAPCMSITNIILAPKWPVGLLGLTARRCWCARPPPHSLRAPQATAGCPGHGPAMRQGWSKASTDCIALPGWGWRLATPNLELLLQPFDLCAHRTSGWLQAVLHWAGTLPLWWWRMRSGLRATVASTIASCSAEYLRFVLADSPSAPSSLPPK